MSTASFLAFMRKIWKRSIQTALSSVPCLEQLSGKISWEWKILLVFKMWLQCLKRDIIWYGSWDGATGTTRNFWTLFLFQICRYLRGKGRLEIQARNENLQKLALLKAKGRDNWSYSVQKAVKSACQRRQGCDWGWPSNCTTAIAVIKVLKSMVWGDAWKPVACRCQYAIVWLWAFNSWCQDIWERG